MQVRVVHGNITDVKADTIIVNLFTGVSMPGGATGAVDKATGGMISKLIRSEGFAGDLGDCLTFYTSDLGGSEKDSDSMTKVVVVGLGERDEFDLEAVRIASAAAMKAAMSGNNPRGRIGTIVHGGGIGGLDSEKAAQAVLEGSLLAAYTFSRYKTTPTIAPQGLVLTEFDQAKLSHVERGVRRGIVFAESTHYARDLVNTPPNDLTPNDLAQSARQLADELGLDCKILTTDDMRRLGMGALLGVAQGSHNPPRMIVLKHQGAPSKDSAPLALVGKGVTFDSGGLSLKTADGMLSMKDDMAGAAAVLGAMRIIGTLKPQVNVLAIVPCVENMPSGTAQRPGDVVRVMDGQTIEIHNTDAEGRLILADAVAYARSLDAAAIIDVATLTGAVGIALGDLYTGVISNHDGFVARLLTAADRTGERFWQLPGDSTFKEQYKSDIADLKNVGGRRAGAITGGLIIGEFAGDTPWIHLDIGGTASREKPWAYLPKGATGVGVRTLAEMALTWDLSTLHSPESTD